MFEHDESFIGFKKTIKIINNNKNEKREWQDRLITSKIEQCLETPCF